MNIEPGKLKRIITITPWLRQTIPRVQQQRNTSCNVTKM